MFTNVLVFSTYATYVVMSFMMLVMIFMLVPQAQVSAERINEVLDTKPHVVPGAKTEGSGTGTVEFRDVSFRYPGAAADELEHISFKVEKGQTLAIIGATGSGKTTLASLIPRFYDATAGTVLVDGLDVREYTFDALYNKLGYVTQKAVLFSVVTPACKETLVKELVSTMHLTAPGSGIAVCLPLSSIGGKSAMNYLTSGDPSKAPEIDIEEDHTMKEAAYQLIVAIANQGYTDKVMEAARSAGARGGTIVHTRSTGAEDAGKFFGMSIAEEREMIFIVAPTSEKNAIMQAIMAQAGPSTKAQAITLSLALEDVVGLFTTNPDQ